MERPKLLPGFDFESFGTDNEDDIEFISPSSTEQILLWPSDWTVETIIRQIDRGNIILNPEFQRRDVWRVERKSKFIESLIINLPVPQIVLAEDPLDRTKFIVVDGKQRLLSILQFFGANGWERYRLKGLKILPYDDLDVDSLPPTVRDTLENRPVRCVIIKGAPSKKLLNIIFHRLNSNTIALSSQELRQSLYTGPFTRFCERYTRENSYLSELLGSNGPDFRMRDVELFIRHVAFKINFNSYSGNLKNFLDSTTEQFNADWDKFESTIKELSVGLKRSVDATYYILGEDAFRKYNTKTYLFEYQFNRAIFDVFTYYLSDPITVENVEQSRAEFVNSYKVLFSNPDFLKSIESTTKSKSAVSARFGLFGQLVGKFNNAVIIPIID